MSFARSVLRVLLTVVLAVLLLAIGFIAYLSATEFTPDAVEDVKISGDGGGTVKPDETIDVLSWNIGYCALGKGADFFMDGGSGVRAESREAFDGYLSGVSSTLSELDPDIVMLQEVDRNSSRTFGVNEVEKLSLGNSAYALNYSCPYVPYPLPTTIGKVNSGLLTYSGYEMSAAQRISLPCPFSWPLRIANLKRCMLPSYFPIEGSDKQLVLVNVHLEAYDDGEGKAAQTKELISFIEGEYAKGNYVIVGGDFNQSFPGSLEVYPNTHAEYWTPGVLEQSILPDGWSYAYDTLSPSCRLLNQPFDSADTAGTQYYVIDGFIFSPNVQLETVSTLDLGFENSDHNPVLLRVRTA